MAVFDINGNDIGGNPFLQNALVERGVYKNVQYHLVRINKRKYDGTYQYPFVLAPDGMGAASKSALDFALLNNYPIVTNAGIFDTRQDSNTKKPFGILIVNSTIVNNDPLLDRTYQPLLIDTNGDLSYTDYDTEASELSGIVSAVLGFGPLVVNYVGRTIDDYAHPGGWDTDSQRMIIGQFGNGDYAIIASEGRGFDDSTLGWTVGDAVDFCVSINLKFAYNLDGGGSTELVIDKKQLNAIYEGTTGRKVPTFIMFNGTDTFGEPED